MRGVQWFLLRFMQCRIEPDCTVPAFPASQGCPICNTSPTHNRIPLVGISYLGEKNLNGRGGTYGELPMYKQAAWTSLAVSITSYGRR